MKELKEFLDKYNVKYTVEGNTVIADNIYLSNKGISKLPESFGNIKCNKLNLSSNIIKELPESFGNIKCRYIWLQHNKIIQLPESFGNIRCEYLDISYNELGKLPDSFSNIKCNHLWLEDNKLSKLPEYNKFGYVEITDQYINCDGIFNWYEDVSTYLDYTVYNGYNGFIITNNGDMFSHGHSFSKCIIDLLFKLCDRNKIKYSELYKDDQLTIEDASLIYDSILKATKSAISLYLEEPIIWRDSINILGGYIVYVGYCRFKATKNNIIFSYGFSIKEAIETLEVKLKNM